MKRVKLIASASAIAVLALLAVNVGAQQTNVQERTFLTFSSPVEMPGVVLEAGTYEFRLADTPRRNVVQVFRKDANDIVGQWTFVESQRPRVSEETVVMFRETAEGATPAVQYWYFPGERIGKEFIYPKDQAERIAARTGQQVRTEDGVAGEQRAEANAAAGAAADASAAQTSTAPATAAGSAAADVDVDARADVDRRESAGVSARADADLDVENRDVTDADRSEVARAETPQQQPSAAAQPTAPAGSTTGSRATAGQSDVAQSDASARADATLTAQPQPEADRSDAAASARAESQIASRQQDADPARPVGTTGAQEPREAEGQFRAAGELPRTASPLALAGLIGLLSLAGAAGVRRFYR